jgi:exosortase A-associated hydrolase 2
MNQARRMVAEQARILAQAGYGVLLLDLFGTGDSAGDVAEATWEIWLEDIAAGGAWLARRGRPLAGLWGLRLGATLAVEAAAASAAPAPRLLLWQPVVSGRAYLTQILRLRVAAGLGGDGARETTADLRGRWAAGELVEIAGYPIAPVLAERIDAASLRSTMPPPHWGVVWLDLVTGQDAAPAPAAVNTVAEWRQNGIAVRHDTVVGEAFWAVQSWLAPVTVPALWEATSAAWAEAPATSP